MSATRPSGKLPIKVRRVRRQGRTSAELVIDCPRRNRALHVDECTWCDHGGGFHLDPAGASSYLRCLWGEVEKAPENCRGWSSAEGSIGEAMQGSPTPVASLTNAREVLVRFIRNGEEFAPVIDETGLLIGEVERAQLERAEANDTVEAVMKPLVFSVPREGSLEIAVALMCSEGVHRVYVVAGAGVIGVVTSIDMLAWAAERRAV
jgi:CBS domain-containing protein